VRAELGTGDLAGDAKRLNVSVHTHRQGGDGSHGSGGGLLGKLRQLGSGPPWAHSEVLFLRTQQGLGLGLGLGLD